MKSFQITPDLHYINWENNCADCMSPICNGSCDYNKNPMGRQNTGKLQSWETHPELHMQWWNNELDRPKQILRHLSQIYLLRRQASLWSGNQPETGHLGPLLMAVSKCRITEFLVQSVSRCPPVQEAESQLTSLSGPLRHSVITAWPQRTGSSHFFHTPL